MCWVDGHGLVDKRSDAQYQQSCATPDKGSSHTGGCNPGLEEDSQVETGILRQVVAEDFHNQRCYNLFLVYSN